MPLTGTIKKIVADKGFGFILQDKSETEYFFHHSQFRGIFENLRAGDAVQFKMGEERAGKGPRAEDVRVL